MTLRRGKFGGCHLRRNAIQEASQRAALLPGSGWSIIRSGPAPAAGNSPLRICSSPESPVAEREDIRTRVHAGHQETAVDVRFCSFAGHLARCTIATRILRALGAGDVLACLAGDAFVAVYSGGTCTGTALPSAR